MFVETSVLLDLLEEEVQSVVAILAATLGLFEEGREEGFLL